MPDLPPPIPSPAAVQAPAPPAARPEDEVVVHAATLRRNSFDSPSAIGSIMRPPGYIIVTVPRSDEALAVVPGASLFRRTSSLGANPTTQGVSLRGIGSSGASRALITLDGVPQNDPFGGWVIWSGLPPQSIARTVVERGAASGPYGAGALTGTVSIIGRHKSGLDAFVGEQGQRQADGAFNQSFAEDRGELFLAAAGGHSDGWIPVRTGRGAADQPLSLDFASAQGRLSYDFAGGSGAARLAAWREARGSGLTGARSRTRGGQFSLSFARQADADMLGYSLQGWVSWSDLMNTSVAVAAGRATTTPANAQDETPATGWGLNAAVRREWGDWSLDLGADLRAADGETRERFRYMAGAFTRDRVAGGANLDVGVYAGGRWTSDPWQVDLEIRADRWSTSDGRRHERDRATLATTLDVRPPDRDDILPTARAGVKWSFGDRFLRAAAYQNFRQPTLNELHRPFRVGNDLTEANAALEPERLLGGEIAIGQRGDDDNSHWNLTLFAARLEDPVTNVTVGIGPFTDPVAGFVPAGGVLRQRRNAGRIDAYGLEGEITRGWGERLFLRAALSLTHARVDGEAAAPQLTGLRPAQTPEAAFTAGFDWKPTDRLILRASLRAEGARFDDDLNTRRLGPSVSANAEVNWALNEDALVYLAVDNIGDNGVQTGRTADGIVSYGPSRAARVGLRLAF